MSKASTAPSWDSFTTAETMDARYSIQWAGQGQGGAGKTYFLLTAPDPIFVHLFDPKGIEPILQAHPELRKKDIRWQSYNFNPGKLAISDRPKAAKDALDRFLDIQAVALKKARTIGFDKEDHVYEMLRYARLESYTDRPSSYYELNLEYRGWFADAAEAGVNLGVIRGMKERWGQNDKGSPVGTGTYMVRGQKEVNELVQVVLHHYFDEDEKVFKYRVGGQEGDDPKVRVGPATELIGQTFAMGDGFIDLAYTLYPETIDTPEVWGQP